MAVALNSNFTTNWYYSFIFNITKIEFTYAHHILALIYNVHTEMLKWRRMFTKKKKSQQKL